MLNFVQYYYCSEESRGTGSLPKKEVDMNLAADEKDERVNITTLAGAYATVAVSELRKGIKEIFQDVEDHGTRLVVSNHGRPIAAVVPIADLLSLKIREDKIFADMKSEPSKSDDLKIVQNCLDSPEDASYVKEKVEGLVTQLVQVFDDHAEALIADKLRHHSRGIEDEEQKEQRQISKELSP